LSKSITPFKKGTARVAFQTAFDSNLKENLTIETIALNFSFHGFRSDLVIRVGDSIDLAPYEDLYKTLPNHAISKLTLNMYDVFEKNVLHVLQPERTLYVETLLRMLFVDVQNDATLFFEKGRIVCAQVSSLTEDAFSIAQQDLIDYETQILNYGILDNEISQPSTRLLERSFLLMIFSPIALLGFFFWQLIFKFSKWIADKTVTREDFYTSVFSGVAGVLGLIWWLILCIATFSMGTSVGFMVVAVSPVFYYFSLKWIEELRYLRSSFKARSLVKQQASLHQSLVLWRRKIAFWN
jgi:hypothetical protein